MPRRVTLERFLQFMERELPHFSGYPHVIKFNLCHMAYGLKNKYRQHSNYKGYAMMPYQERDKLFKYKAYFNAMNADLGFFELTPNWSKKNKWTKGIRLSPKIDSLLLSFRRSDPLESELIYSDGSRMGRSPRNAVRIDRKLHVKPFIRSDVPINMVELRKLRDYYKDREGGDEIHDEICDVLHFATTSPMKLGYLLQRYYYIDSGRLYADCPVPLQSVRNIVCNTALAGHWEYDFVNCHYAIFSQLCDKAGISVPFIDTYLANTDFVRVSVANEVGISKDQAKKCLLMIMYGAVESTWRKAAITKAIGVDEARLLFKHPMFSGILTDIKRARRPIIDNCASTQRSHINAMGRPIPKIQPKSGKRTPDKFLLAHILQGIEAQMLHVAIEMHGDHIILLKHDGWSMVIRVDVSAIVGRVLEVTGFEMEMTCKQHVSGVSNADSTTRHVHAGAVLTEKTAPKIGVSA